MKQFQNRYLLIRSAFRNEHWNECAPRLKFHFSLRLIKATRTDSATLTEATRKLFNSTSAGFPFSQNHVLFEMHLVHTQKNKNKCRWLKRNKTVSALNNWIIHIDAFRKTWRTLIDTSTRDNIPASEINGGWRNGCRKTWGVPGAWDFWREHRRHSGCAVGNAEPCFRNALSQ